MQQTDRRTVGRTDGNFSRRSQAWSCVCLLTEVFACLWVLWLTAVVWSVWLCQCYYCLPCVRQKAALTVFPRFPCLIFFFFETSVFIIVTGSCLIHRPKRFSSNLIWSSDTLKSKQKPSKTRDTIRNKWKPLPRQNRFPRLDISSVGFWYYMWRKSSRRDKR